MQASLPAVTGEVSVSGFDVQARGVGFAPGRDLHLWGVIGGCYGAIYFVALEGLPSN